MRDIASHPQVDVVALCDVDQAGIDKALAAHPGAKTFKDYRVMLREMKDEIDAVIVATPDHTHAPASLMAMELDKPVYCQKPLTHSVYEARALGKAAKEAGLALDLAKRIQPAAFGRLDRVGPTHRPAHAQLVAHVHHVQPVGHPAGAHRRRAPAGDQAAGCGSRRGRRYDAAA